MAGPNQPSPAQLRLDVLWAKGLLWLASSGRLATPRPEVHRYLYDRYWRLAAHHERRGATRRAERLHSLAGFHYRAAGMNEPPPAVAVALPAPQRPRIVWAVAEPEEPPDDAA